MHSTDRGTCPAPSYNPLSHVPEALSWKSFWVMVEVNSALMCQRRVLLLSHLYSYIYISILVCLTWGLLRVVKTETASHGLQPGQVHQTKRKIATCLKETKGWNSCFAHTECLSSVWQMSDSPVWPRVASARLSSASPHPPPPPAAASCRHEARGWTPSPQSDRPGPGAPTASAERSGLSFSPLLNR